MRELRVEDALLYLDQVKMEFSDRPHIYNEFLDIMKTFKTQQIDTPGVIRRVSNLFQGNKALVLGFNTFLPEGYKIELPQDGDGQPVAVYRAPGQTGVTHILGPNAPPLPAPIPNPPPAQSATIMRAQQQQQHPLQQQKQQQLQQQQPTISQSQPQQQSRPQFLQTQQHSISAPTMGGMVEYQQRVPPGPPQQPRLTHPMASVPKPLSRPTMLAAATTPQPSHPPQQQASAQQASTAKQPVEFDHAINYVTTIKNRFAGEPDTYKKFLEILHTYQKEQRGIKEVLDEVSLLFADHPDLLKEFTFFLPDAVQAQAKAQLEKAAKESEARIRANASRQAIMQQAQGMQQAATGPQPRRASVPNAPPQAQPIPQQVVVQQVIAQQVSPQQVAQKQVMPPQVMPSQVIPSQTMPSQGVPVQVLPPQVAPQLEPSPEPERSYSPSPAPIPFGASKGRSEEREREIIRSAVHGTVSFTPSPPPRRAEISASQVAQKYGRPQIIPDLPTQPTTAEAAFFERAKLHLNRKELAPDKPPGSRRHTPYTEFLKCLHLFGAGILSKDELVLLLKGLFMQGHAPKSGSNAGGGASNPAVANDAQELLREFEEILVGRGHFADQENLLKDKSKYGDKQVRDFDFSGCEKPTPSYRTIPSDYPTNLFHSHSGQSGMDASVLNNTLLCLPARRSTRFVLSPDEYDGPSERNNIYEGNMFKVEDERYEVDMAIERNGKAMSDVEPISQEISRLKDQEEKDGQPIGRMQYKLRPRQLKSFHIGAIGRLYGDHGDEVVQQLLRNPIAVLPIVYQRLRDKDSEWRKIKGESMKRWALINEENYLGSLDALSFENKRMLGRLFDEKHLIKVSVLSNLFLYL
jgi:paired amphipathic helix protein Sin3a